MMSKNINLQENFNLNFILKGINSIQIGIYFLISAYIIKTIFNGFLSDSSLIGMMSIEIIEIMIIAISIFFFIFLFFALFFSNRRTCRKNKILFWNSKTKATFWVSLCSLILVFVVLIYFKNQGLFSLLTPLFLLFYGVYLLLYNFRKKKEFVVLGVITLLLSFTTFFIPTYWFNAILILGIGHIVYGIIIKK